ncbi:hypothetical protein Pan44_16240 [Caulifigura coniformis]|uniref:Uncharacterized protein n=1 Tax=Caulifigura coniformis TaxID=2527983 RepID=A0A517SBV5_9PLAN|nr:hypothetical protein [Caulifigura coniformis]QDT53602.1 hypothetical protein Pan44_16240 [Caulifigura coniformis]
MTVTNSMEFDGWLEARTQPGKGSSFAIVHSYVREVYGGVAGISTDRYFRRLRELGHCIGTKQGDATTNICLKS